VTLSLQHIEVVRRSARGAVQLRARRGGHSHGLASFSLVFDEPLSWPVFEQAMAVLPALRGSDLLRVKGLVTVEECWGPVVVHFVQHVAHPPIELEDWPDEDRRSRLVFITRGPARAAVEELFAGVAAVAAPAHS
jgi:G3E family GTPase